MIRMETCGCERGGPCTRTTVCAANALAEEALDEMRRVIDDLIEAIDGVLGWQPGGAESIIDLRAELRAAIDRGRAA